MQSMDFAQFRHGDDDRFSQRTLSDISITSSASAKGRSISTDPGFPASRHAHGRKVKLMCSFGGKILLRPSDRKLRYVGGETRMISVPRSIHYAAFVRKLVDIYGPDIALKYQLPDEDLDALVSVSSDEDLENMMEECDRLDLSDGGSRLRVFIFTPSELEDADLSDLADPKIAEQKYVDAVNTMVADVVPRKHDDLVLPYSLRNSAGLDGYSWNAVPSENPQLENFLANSDYLNPKLMLPVDLTPPSSNSSAMQQPTVPLEFVSYHGDASLANQDFLDLERADSANSSASSQHEFYNRFANSRLIPSSQVQAQPVPELNNTFVDDHAAPQSFIMDTEGLHGIWASRPPVALTSPHQVTELQPIEPEREGPLSPGAALQKQLEIDRLQGKRPNFTILSDAQDPSVNDQFLPRQAFQQNQLMQEQNSWQTQPFYDPLVGLGIGIPLIGHTNSVENSSRAQAEVCPLPGGDASASFLLTSSAPSSPPGPFMEQLSMHQVPMTAFSDADYTRHLYTHDPGLASQAPWLPHPPVFYETSTSAIQNSPVMFTPVNTNLETHGFSEEIQVPAKMFNDVESTSEAAPWLATKNPSHLDLRGDNSTQNIRGGLPVNFTQSLEHYGDGLPGVLLSGHTAMARGGENRDEALPFVKRVHSPGLTLLEETPLLTNKNDFVTAAQNEVQNFNNIGVLSPPFLKGDLPTVDMVSDLLQSTHLNDRIQRETRPADIIQASQSGESLDRIAGGGVDLAHQMINNSTSSAPLEKNSIGGGLDLLLDGIPSTEKCSSSIHQEDEMLYVSASKEMSKLDSGAISESLATTFQGDTFSAPASLVATSEMLSAAPASLSATWTVLMAGTAHGEEGKDGEEAESLIMEKTVRFESSVRENQELDTFESAADRPINAAAVAEAEAIARGLQTIRNCDLEELRELGSGTFGTVYHGKWRGTDVAIKRIKSSVFTGRPSERERLIADFWREACLLGQLHHPNVVAFYGVVPDGPGGTLATVTEYMVNGSLKQVLLKNDRTLDRRKRLLIAMDAAFGMEYLHGKNVVHFDMKCENLLVNLRDTQRPICKVGDLGLSKVKQQTMISGGVRGTLPWMAPELLNGSSSLVSEKVDVFSFGIVLWELLTGEEPYANMHYGAIIGGIVNNTLRPPVPRWCDPAWRVLMERCWSADPFERPTFSEIVGSLRAMQASLQKAPSAGTS